MAALDSLRSLIDSWDFWLFGQSNDPKIPKFKGYISSIDPTTAGIGVLIGGSQNVWKTLRGSIKVRDGLKRRGIPNATQAGVTSSTEWETSLGATRVLRVTEENKLQVESDIADGSTLQWYDLMTNLDSTRFIFVPWWSNSLQKDSLIFVKFDPNLYSWAGGIAKLVSANTNDTAGIVATMALQAPGTGYVVGNVLTISGGGGTGATLTVTEVAGNGAITAFTLTTRGSGYSNTVGAATTGGAGAAATITITTATGEIVLDRDASQVGFDPSGSVTINGNTYTYGSVSGASLLGISPDPTSEANDSIVLSAVITTPNTPAANFSNDFCFVVGNQLQVGSYDAHVVYVSDQDDYTNFVVPAVRAPGDPDLLTLDSELRGGTIFKQSAGDNGNALFSGSAGDWYLIVRSQITVGTDLTEQVQVIKTQTSDLASAQSQEFIDSFGGSVIFLDENNQLRQFGFVKDIFNTTFPLLSLDVYSELKTRNFSGGHLRAISEEGDTTVHITAPQDGIDYMYQIREKINEVGNLIAERLWQPPHVRGASRVAVIEGISYVYSNQNPQMYQIWDTGQYYDDSPSGDEVEDQLPYECHAIPAYLSLNDRTKQLFFDKLYTEGYMTQGTFLYCNIYQEYVGSKNIVTVRINIPTNPGKKLARFYPTGNQPSLGDVSLGQIPLGEGILPRGGSVLPKFRAIRRVQATSVFEYALDYFSVAANSQWELLIAGTNQMQTPGQPAQLG